MRSDEDIMEAVGDGHIDAFETIVERHRETAWGVAYRLMGNADDAEEMAQEAFLKIFQARDRYEPTASFKTYLYRVVTRLCYDRMEKKSPDHVDPLDQTLERNASRAPDDELIDAERKKQIYDALNKLPNRQKVAITLQHFEQLQYDEIADVMDTSKKAVERLIARARNALSDLLSDQFDESNPPAFHPVHREDD